MEDEDGRSLRDTEVRRVLRAYKYCRAGAHACLSNARASEDGQFYQCMACMVFVAFWLEGLLNYLGERKLTDWSNHERKSPTKKLALITMSLGVRTDADTRPFKTFKQVFKFRNELAHNRTVELLDDEPQLLGEGDRPVAPLAEWEAQVSVVNAETFFEDAKEIELQLAAASRLPGSEFVGMGWTYTRVGGPIPPIGPAPSASEDD